MRVVGSVLLVLAIALLAILPAAPVVRNPPGFLSPIMAFELAGSPAEVHGILGRPGDPGRPAAVRAMVRGNLIDFGFMLVYPLFYVAIAWLLAVRGLSGRATVAAVMALAPVMALADAGENMALLHLAVAHEPAAMTDALDRLRLFTSVKWIALFGASALLAPGIWRTREWWRWAAPALAGGALLAAAAPLARATVEYGAYLVMVGWTLSWVWALRR